IGPENDADALHLESLDAVDGPNLTLASRVDRPMLRLRQTKSSPPILELPGHPEIADLHVELKRAVWARVTPWPAPASEESCRARLAPVGLLDLPSQFMR